VSLEVEYKLPADVHCQILKQASANTAIAWSNWLLDAIQ
jgi:hypothetical protein